jgi:hypothetical protein
MAQQAVVIAERLIEVLPAVAEKPDYEKTPAELLFEGTRAALIVGRDICRRYSAAEDDPKMLRLVSDTAGWLARLGVGVSEGEFRPRRTSANVLRVLEAIAKQDADATPAIASPELLLGAAPCM